MKMTLSMRFMHDTLDRLDLLGFSKETGLKVADLPPEFNGDIESRITIEKLVEVFAAAEKALNDPYIGLRTGYKFRISNYAKTGNIYNYCRNIQQVIVTNSKYQKIAIDAGEIQYDQELDSQSGKIRHFMTFRSYCEGDIRYRHVLNSILGAYGTAYRWLSWSSGDDILNVDLPYERPADTRLHRRAFKDQITYGQPVVRFEFSDKTMNHQLTTFDAEKFAQADAQLSALIGEHNYKIRLELAVKMAMRAALENHQVSTHVVAERLQKSWHNLRKELTDAGLSYRALLETVRREIFHEGLAAHMSLSEISQTLAYNDQAAFTKAFKRWYGVSPRQWKAAYQIGQGEIV